MMNLTMQEEGSLNDQHFLLNFIMSNYLGPDVISDNPKRSASRRLAEGLPLYAEDDLGRSFFSIFELESLYCYVLRNADRSLILKRNLFHMYLRGNLLLPNSDLSEDIDQFTTFFPSNLHEQTSFLTSSMIVKGVVLIEDPVSCYMNSQDLEKFLGLSGFGTNLKIDMNDFLKYQYIYWTGRDDNEQHNMMKSMSGIMVEENAHTNHPAVLTWTPPQKESRKRPRSDSSPHISSQMQQTTPTDNNPSDKIGEKYPMTWNWDRPSVMPLLSTPNDTEEEVISKASIILTGTAKKGRGGPPVGVVDIGVSKSAYLFQVALPGVNKDSDELSCEIECDGKVHIQGVSSTGGETVKKETRVFQMNIQQQLCPPGPFTLSFSLPGPVDPRLFSPKFRDDGIFEAVVVKGESASALQV